MRVVIKLLERQKRIYDYDGGDVDVDCGVFVCLSRNGCHQRRLIDLKRIRSIQWLATSTRFLVLLLSSSSS